MTTLNPGLSCTLWTVPERVHTVQGGIWQRWQSKASMAKPDSIESHYWLHVPTGMVYDIPFLAPYGWVYNTKRANKRFRNIFTFEENDDMNHIPEYRLNKHNLIELQNAKQTIYTLDLKIEKMKRTII